MQSVVLEFENERALQEALVHIWERLGVSGELMTQRMPEGHFRMEVVSEKPIRGATLEKIGGRVLE